MERYRSAPPLPPDKAALDAAYKSVQDGYYGRATFASIFAGIEVIDKMGQSNRFTGSFRYLGEQPYIRRALSEEIDRAKLAGDDERVMTLIRVSHVMGHTEDPSHVKAARLLDKASNLLDVPPAFNPLKGLANLLGQNPTGTLKRDEYDLLFEKHKRELEAKQAAAAAAAAASAAGAGSRARLTEWPRINTVGKRTEWTTTVAKVEADWQRVGGSLSTHYSPTPTKIRLSKAMQLVQEAIRVSTQSITNQAPGIQAMIEFLIPKIWSTPPDGLDLYEYAETFFKRNPQPSGVLFVGGFDDVTKALFIPEDLRDRATPLTALQKALIKKIHRRYAFALHSDKTKHNPDTSKELVDFVDILLKEVNMRWNKLEPLTS